MNLSKNAKIVYGLVAKTVASNTDSNTTIMDMSGWDGVIFFTTITDSIDTGVATLNVQGSAANSDSAMTTITNATAAATSAANDDLNAKLLIVDVYRPLLRYIQGNITSATANIAFGETHCILYRGSKAPVTQPSATTAKHTFVVGS